MAKTNGSTPSKRGARTASSSSSNATPAAIASAAETVLGNGPLAVSPAAAGAIAAGTALGAVGGPHGDAGTVDYDPNIIGSTGLRQYGGFVVEEFLKELKGVRGAATYKEMADNDPVVGAILFAIEMLITGTPFNWQAADESPQAKADKQFAEEVFSDMSSPMSDVLTEIASMFTYGYAPMEIIWKKRNGPDSTDPSERSQYTDGKVGIRNLSLRAQSSIVRWQFDPVDGGIQGVWQQPIAGPMVYIPITKMVLFRTRNERNNPEGRSILRNAYRPWYFKKRLEEIEGIGIERDLAGLPVAMIPGSYMDVNADTQQKKVASDWKRLVTNVRKDKQMGVVIPSDRDQHGNLLFDFKLISSGGSRAIDTTKIIDRYDNRITATVLADFIMLGQQGRGGSHALSQNKSDIFAQAIKTFLERICDTINRFLMPRLWKLNGKNVETMPTLAHGDVAAKDLQGLAAMLTALAAAGAQLFPDPDLENHIREEAGLPPAAEDGLGWGAPDPQEAANAAATAVAMSQAGVPSPKAPGMPGAGGKAPVTPPATTAMQQARSGPASAAASNPSAGGAKAATGRKPNGSK
jgi:hypothetical protein